MRFLSKIDFIQRRLDFENWYGYPQFQNENGLGRIALISFTLGVLLSVHSMLFIITFSGRFETLLPSMFFGNISDTRIKLILQWLLFVVFMCIFHLAEFFITAIFNPKVVNASSFVINHSKAFTSAMLVAFAEFWIKFLFFPWINSKVFFIIGFIIVVSGQLIRSMAMITCGESFNHIIQHSKKDNHRLVTTGIYSYLRHPSYTGFFYWSIGTQFILGNCICSVLFAVASWLFFHRRIPFEEMSLLKLFPDEYPSYMERTKIYIPFIKSRMKNHQS